MAAAAAAAAAAVVDSPFIQAGSECNAIHCGQLLNIACVC